MSQYGSDPNHPETGQPGAAGTPPPPANPYGEPSPYGQPAQQNPYGQPNAYGQPDPAAQQSPYGQPDAYGQQNPYGAPPNPYGDQGYGAPPGAFAGGYASWFKRVAAYLIDAICALLAGLPLWIGYGMLIANAKTTTNPDDTTTTTVSGGGVILLLILVGLVTYAAFWIWNVCLRQGRTGYSIGKGTIGIKLIAEQTGQPMGAFMSFLRQILHVVDSICYVGYLWPLWDSKRQTFSDKIMHTVVIIERERD